jgi:AcrR family transcriptional regulator
MIETPWGEVQSLPDLDREEATPDGRSDLLHEKPAKERLFAAMIGACTDRGYEATTVTDLLALSGLSRATFYELFENKADCYNATLEATLGTVIGHLDEPFESDLPPEKQARECLSRLLALAADQPAAARLCVVEPYVAGETAMDSVLTAAERLRHHAREALSHIRGREMPEEASQAIVGGIRHILFRRLYFKEWEGLAELEQPIWDWVLSYEPPPQPLRLRGRRPKPVPHDGGSAFAAYYPAERIIRGFASAVAEKGYPATTIADISAHASISQRTFYEYFDGKEELLRAALDSSGMQFTAAVLPAIRRSPGWPDSVRASFGAACAFFAAEPELAHLRQVAVYAAGPDAIAHRDAVGTEIFREMLSGAEALEVDPVAREAVVGALYSVIHRQIRTQGAASAPELAPLLTYIALAPFIGAERACEVANGDGLRAS